MSIAYATTEIIVPDALRPVATGINDAGQVVGEYDDVTGTVHPFRWKGGKFADLSGSTSLGPALASAVNAAGDVVGNRYVGGDFNDSRVFISVGGTNKELPLLKGYTTALAADINDADVVAGNEYSGDQSTASPFLYANGVLTDLGKRLKEPAIARQINDAGQVVGWMVSSTPQGFLYDTARNTVRYFSFPAGPLFGPASTRAEAINNKGVVVGNWGQLGQENSMFL